MSKGLRTGEFTSAAGGAGGPGVVRWGPYFGSPPSTVTGLISIPFAQAVGLLVAGCAVKVTALTIDGLDVVTVVLAGQYSIPYQTFVNAILSGQYSSQFSMQVNAVLAQISGPIYSMQVNTSISQPSLLEIDGLKFCQAIIQMVALNLKGLMQCNCSISAIVDLGYNVAGSFTFTPYFGGQLNFVDCFGGGGGGGNSVVDGGGGGGGGGHARATNVNVVTNVGEPIVVGGGGGPTFNGQDTTFRSAGALKAAGGGKGTNGSAGGPGSGGTGGDGTGTIMTSHHVGGNGANGQGTNGGAGGGGAGSTANGSAGSGPNTGGAGGAPEGGTGGIHGAAGNILGGAGGGASTTDVGGAGAGNRGRVRINFTMP